MEKETKNFEELAVITTNEVVEYYRITKKTLFKMIREGKIRAFKVGNAYRFKKAELEEDLRIDNK